MKTEVIHITREKSDNQGAVASWLIFFLVKLLS